MHKILCVVLSGLTVTKKGTWCKSDNLMLLREKKVIIKNFFYCFYSLKKIQKVETLVLSVILIRSIVPSLVEE